MFSLDGFKIILYLRSKSLEIYSTEFKENYPILDFPADVLDSLEIVNQEKFDQLLSKYLTGIKLKGEKVLILLANELIFQKNISAGNPEQIDADIQKFLDEVPFDPQQISRVDQIGAKGRIVLTTSKKLYESVKKVCELADLEVGMVIPAAAFESFPQVGALSLEDIQTVLRNAHLAKELNFLSNSNLQEKKVSRVSTPVIDSTLPKKGKNSVLPIVLLIMILLMFGVMAYLLGYVKLPFRPEVEKPKTQKAVIITPTIEFAPESSSSSAQAKELVKKDDLKIKVLNGSGVSGQAGQVKSALEKLGYKNIETGNAEEEETGKTILQLGDQVDSSVSGEIITALKKIFSDVSEEKQNDSIFDIIITTKK